MTNLIWIPVEEVLVKFPRVECGDGVSPRTLDEWVEIRKFFGYGEEIQRHPSLFCISDFWINLGEITMVEGKVGLAF